MSVIIVKALSKSTIATLTGTGMPTVLTVKSGKNRKL